MTYIGEAVRVHDRETQAREYYRLYRNIYLSRKRALEPDLSRHLMLVMSWRSRWTALQEVIEAAERSERRAA